MKKHVSILLGLMVIFSSLFTSCNEDELELDPNICKITVKSEGNGKVAITDYIGTSVNVLIGNRVEVVATPDDGWAFIGWYISGTESPVSTDASFTFITSENVTLTARFAKLSDIIIRSGGNGSVAFKDSKGNSIPVLPGTEVTVIATPDVDCDFVGWFVGDSETPISTEKVYTFTATENIILTGEFSKRPVVTIRSAGNGSVSIKDTYGTSKAFLPGTEVTVIATPNENCDFIGWFIADDESPVSTDIEYTFEVTEDITLTAKFDSGEYINETFAKVFGVFSTEETLGNYPWVIDYGTAKATSYDNATQANNAATSWLISTPVDFTNETEAYVTFDYIIRYAESGKVAAYHQLLISTDYTGNAAEATWTDLPYNAVEGSDWATFYKANVNIPADFLDKSNVTFALRYTATTKSSTWEVKNFKVARGKVEVVEPEEATEYTVAEAIAAYTGVAKPAVVKGYIVGYIDDKSISDANFSGSAVLKTNLLIADNADETDYTKCLPIQLPSGKVRDALNLVDNPGNYKKLVTLTGSLEKYFGVAGLKSVSAYTIDGETPEEPETPDTPANTYVNEAFTNGFGSFTTQETVGSYPWVSDATYGAKASGYADGASQDAESWLISPAINFASETAAYIAFDYVINKGDASAAAANHKLLITDNYTGDVATTQWTEVNYGAVNNNSWAFQNTGNIALPESMMGKDAVVIAFKYMSTTANSSTWEIKNVVIASGTGATPETPETPEPEEPETPDTPAAEAGVFDFTNPETLTPSIERAPVETGATQGAGVELEEITFTNGNTSVKVSQGSSSSPARFWTRATGDVELRTYKSSTITVSVSEGTMSSILFEGGKVSTMAASTGSFSAGTWSGNAHSVTFSVTGTLNIQKITVK